MVSVDGRRVGCWVGPFFFFFFFPFLLFHGLVVAFAWRLGSAASALGFCFLDFLDTHTLDSSESKHSIQEQLEGQFFNQ